MESTWNIYLWGHCLLGLLPHTEKIIVDSQFRDVECKLRVDFEIGQARAEEQYKYDILYAKSEADNQRFTDVINIRDEHIQSLEKYVRPSNAHWWAIGGFTVGAGAAIGIMYAIKPGLQWRKKIQIML